MGRYVKLSVLFLLMASFFIKQWLNMNLKADLVSINKQNIEHLEFKTNKNFIQFGIENIGGSLRGELLKMNMANNLKIKLVDGCPFYVFQESEVKVNDGNEMISIFLTYDWLHSVFKIRGYRMKKIMIQSELERKMMDDDKITTLHDI